jgi:hypothetical protein
MNKISKINLIDEIRDKDSRHLDLVITDTGDLQFIGQDLGPLTEKLTGEHEYEYFLTVSAQYKDSILLYLIQEKFPDDSAFKKWLDEKQIPHTTFVR